MSIVKKIWWIGQSMDLIQKINSFRSGSNTINKTFVQRIYDQRAVWSPINGDYCQYYLLQKEVSATDDYWTSGYDWGLVPYRRVVLLLHLNLTQDYEPFRNSRFTFPIELQKIAK